MSLFYSDGSGRPAKSVQDIRNENAVVIFDLDGLAYEQFSKVLGTFITADIRNMISNEEDFDTKKLLVFDELSVFFSPLLPTIYSQASGYGYQAIAGTQSFADCDNISTEFTRRLIENSHQFGFLLQSDPEDAERCASIIGTRISAETTHKTEGNNFSSSGTIKAIREFHVHPDDIKNLKPLEMYCYTKNGDKEKIFRVKWDFIKF